MHNSAIQPLKSGGGRRSRLQKWGRNPEPLRTPTSLPTMDKYVTTTT